MRVRWQAAVIICSLTVACGGDPNASSSPSPAAGIRPLTPGDLEPGRYEARGFDVPVTFEVGPGWSHARLSAEFFDLVHGDTLLTFGLPEGHGAVEPFLGSLEDAGLEVTQPERGDVGGLPSQRVFVTQQDVGGATLYATSESTVTLPPDHAASLTLVPVGQRLLVITVDAPELKVGPATGEADLVLATAEIGEAPAR